MAARANTASVPSRLRRGLAALTLLGALLAPAWLQAHDDTRTRALRLLFAQGIALETAGRWADALDRFEAVARARPTANVRFHVAVCLDRLGRLLQAEQNYQRARDAARITNPEVVPEIDARLFDLDGRIPRITIGMAGNTEGVAVQLDGARVQPSKMLRVDPGPHVAVALRYGVPVAASAFSILERRTKSVVLTIYALPSSSRPP
jgi:tetratricopeptide (TPR) repeat protein